MINRLGLCVNSKSITPLLKYISGGCNSYYNSSNSRSMTIMKKYGIHSNPIEQQIQNIEKQSERIKKEREQPLKYKRVVQSFDITPPDYSSVDFSLMPPPKITDSKLLNVAVIGAPNAGKSTLVNTIVGEKVCAVSHIEHTTRDTILGVFTRDDTQIIFNDTPGIIKNFSKKSKVREFVNMAWRIVTEADVVLLVVDATNNNAPDTQYIVNQLEQQMLEMLKEMKLDTVNSQGNKEFILVLNKVDVVKQKSALLDLISKLNEGNIFSDTFIISATNNVRIENLVNYLMTKAKPGEWQFEPDLKTDQTDIFRASEVIKEKLYGKLRLELPYHVVQNTIGWTPFKDGSLRIDHEFIVPKDSHKSIILGHQGKVIKSIYLESKKELEKIFNTKVHLFLTVKCKKIPENSVY
ncbi:hypothetical protein CYY_007595 [Polysphondylium violaceum]|uniref:GTPase Era, mitochondrial n=1 Tax=Polysphondylium violaceum TaxID=133409 RepID=A0A8J4PQL2_9MYCE|nr:hypothetical protein CYY_007595 [Polysphondylium violaceum]